jgi:hypothetical protein
MGHGKWGRIGYNENEVNQLGGQKMKKIAVTVFLSFLLLTGFVSNLSAQGHFEFGFHYGRWSLNLLGNLIEDAISDSLETDLKESILEDIQADYPFLQEDTYTQNVDFDSSGHNYGFELRWYPSGQSGSFSLGLSVEKTRMTVGLTEVTSQLTFTDGSSFAGTTSGEFEINPLTFLLSVRWDLMPSSRVTPYITFGLGGAMISSIEDDEVTWSYTGELDIEGQMPEMYSDSETKTVEELIDELEAEDEEFIGLGFIPFVMLNLGLKGKLAENIHLLVDAGVWNGLVLRGGVALRF